MTTIYTKCEDHYDYFVYQPFNINELNGYSCIDYEDKKIIVKDTVMIKYKENIEKGLSLELIPKMLRTYEICKLAIKINNNNVKFIPQCIFDSKLCMDIIMESGLNLQYIPEKFRTAKLCIIALTKNPIYECIPKELNLQLLVDSSKMDLPESSDTSNDSSDDLENG